VFLQQLVPFGNIICNAVHFKVKTPKPVIFRSQMGVLKADVQNIKTSILRKLLNRFLHGWSKFAPHKFTMTDVQNIYKIMFQEQHQFQRADPKITTTSP